MASLASRGFKTRMQINGTSTTAVQVIGVRGPNLSRDKIDISNFENTNDAKEYLKGMIEPGEITFTIVVAESAMSTIYALLALTTASETYGVKFEDGSYWQGTGFLSGISNEVSREGAWQADITIALTDKPAYTTAA